ncbi:hypothetical protein K435DRAFT_812160 [Dendrothele bispora CBS 962.96]|uniref:Uncharacterized protein n=1 Tax=Dendrothele bispora (strain CBS 962.96) TaxID=1314807 RepID=A0A4S8KQ62_DENBC|nr:hypothetical protein K435DRAFT_812160 [Dendrothele bispora CBS 962.96]
MSGLRTTLRILRDAPTNTSPSSPILQVASANRLIVGAALASSRRSIKFLVDESCSSLTFSCLSTQEAPPEIPKSVTPFGSTPKPRTTVLLFASATFIVSFGTSSPLFQLLEPTTTTTRLHTRASLRHCTFFELSSLDPEMQPSVTSPYVVVYFRQNPALFGKEAQDPFGGLQTFLNNYRVLFSPSTLRTYSREDLVNLADRVKVIFGIIDSWTANENNRFPSVVDRARLTVFGNLRDTIDPLIFQDDFDLRGWVMEDEEVAWDEGQVQSVTLAECKFGRPSTPFSTTKTNDEGDEESVGPDVLDIDFGPPKRGDKFYLAPPVASSRRPAFTGGAGSSTAAPPPKPPKPTQKSALLGPETKTGAATPLSATKTATATRSAPGTTTFTRTTETARKQPNKPSQTATKTSTASKAPAKTGGGASKSSTPGSARPGKAPDNLSLYSRCLTGSVVLVPPAKTATKGSTSTSTTPFNPRKRTQDAISSAQESTPASNLRDTKERAARSCTLPKITLLEDSPEPPPAKKQRLSKPAQTTNAQASSSTSVVRTKTKPKAMAGEDDRGRWHRHYNDFPHVNKLPEVNPQPNYPQAQSLILAKRNGIFANVDTDPAPELRVVEAMAAYTDRVVNGPYPWKCDQCNTSRKTCVFRGHSKKCDACASARNSCSILNKGLKFFFHQEDAAGRVALAPSHMASEAQRARRLRREADLLIDHAARLHYEADIMTAHNTVTRCRHAF